MRSLVAGSFCLLVAAFGAAAPVTPGNLVIVKEDAKEVDAKPGDMVVVRIPNPALAKMVSDLDIKTTGGARLAAAVNASDMRNGMSVPGSGHIKVYVSVAKGDRSGTLELSYKDGAGDEHKRKVTIQIAE